MVLNEEEKCVKITIPPEVKYADLTDFDNEPYLSPKRKQAREKAIERGFGSEYEFAGWLYFNRIDSAQYEGYSVDVLHYTDGGDFE